MSETLKRDEVCPTLQYDLTTIKMDELPLMLVITFPQDHFNNVELKSMSDGVRMCFDATGRFKATPVLLCSDVCKIRIEKG